MAHCAPSRPSEVVGTDNRRAAPVRDRSESNERHSAATSSTDWEVGSRRYVPLTACEAWSRGTSNSRPRRAYTRHRSDASVARVRTGRERS